MGKLDFIEIRNFDSVKVFVERIKRQATKTHIETYQRLILKEYKEISTTIPKYPMDQRRKHKRNEKIL